MSKVKKMIGTGVWWSVVATVGNSFATGLSAVAILLLFRWLGPEQAGEFSVLLAVAMLLAKIADFGINAAVVKVAGNQSKQTWLMAVAHQAFVLKTMSSIAMSCMFWIVCLLLSQTSWAVPYWQSALTWIAMIVMIWYEHLVFAAQSRKAVLTTVITNATQAGTKLLFTIVASLTGSVTLATSLGIFALTPAVPLLLWRWLLPVFSAVKATKVDLAQARTSLLNVMKHTTFLAVANGILENSDILFVQRFLSPSETGLFAGAWRIASFFIIIGYSLASVLNPRVSRYHEPKDQQEYILKALAFSGVMLLSLVIVIPLLPLLVSLTIGPSYSSSVPVLAPMMAGAFLFLATTPLTALFYQVKSDWFFSVTAVLQLIILAVGYLWFVPQYGLLAAGWTRLAAHGVAFGLALGLVLTIKLRSVAKSP